ncbi:MAG TPA: type III pantothenate kinase [Thiolapillus brandeum]|uniref:Type III pantothenate kinase n=1 Tax=Thiolapillus brandeum TaxID=1076588 RepID=A0A7C5IY26_9GAMM|nr:type III pantothenate kinase [Thiolapillus brandeum]
MADLLVDLGSSRLKWALADDALGPVEAVTWKGRGLKALLDARWGGMTRPARVAASAVAPAPVKEALGEWVRGRWRLEIRFVSATQGWPGLECAYADPARLGADRWAAMVAAHVCYPEGCLVVDCGTAVTLDALAGGRHLGGYILPGVQAMREAVLGETAVEVTEGGEIERWGWGDTTASCLELGIAGAVAALVEASLERLQGEGVCDPTLVITGGQAGSILPLIQVDYRRHDHLVLEGVRLCSRRTLE